MRLLLLNNYLAYFSAVLVMFLNLYCTIVLSFSIINISELILLLND